MSCVRAYVCRAVEDARVILTCSLPYVWRQCLPLSLELTTDSARLTGQGAGRLLSLLHYPPGLGLRMHSIVPSF